MEHIVSIPRQVRNIKAELQEPSQDRTEKTQCGPPAPENLRGATSRPGTGGAHRRAAPSLPRARPRAGSGAPTGAALGQGAHHPALQRRTPPRAPRRANGSSRGAGGAPRRGAPCRRQRWGRTAAAEAQPACPGPGPTTRPAARGAAQPLPGRSPGSMPGTKPPTPPAPAAPSAAARGGLGAPPPAAASRAANPPQPQRPPSAPGPTARRQGSRDPQPVTSSPRDGVTWRAREQVRSSLSARPAIRGSGRHRPSSSVTRRDGSPPRARVHAGLRRGGWAAAPPRAPAAPALPRRCRGRCCPPRPAPGRPPQGRSEPGRQRGPAPPVVGGVGYRGASARALLLPLLRGGDAAAAQWMLAPVFLRAPGGRSLGGVEVFSPLLVPALAPVCYKGNRRARLPEI